MKMTLSKEKAATDSLKCHINDVVKKLLREVINHYGKRLISFAIFGSFARGTYRHDSDLDILIIAERLPRGRIRRTSEFIKIEKNLDRVLKDLYKRGIYLELSPIIKTPLEALSGSPLFFDMVEDAVILYDRKNFLRDILRRLKKRTDLYGSKRIWKGNAWYWDLKPDFRPGEILEI